MRAPDQLAGEQPLCADCWCDCSPDWCQHKGVRQVNGRWLCITHAALADTWRDPNVIRGGV